MILRKKAIAPGRTKVLLNPLLTYGNKTKRTNRPVHIDKLAH